MGVMFALVVSQYSDTFVHFNEFSCTQPADPGTCLDMLGLETS